MRRIAILNQKGGVGKTTTAANLGAALARLGRRVVVVDMDPQANLTLHLGLEPSNDAPSTYSVLMGQTTFAEALEDTSTPGLRVCPSHIDLSGAELELAGTIGRERVLTEALATWEDSVEGEPADYLLFDCAPSLGLLTINALTAAQEVFITLQTEFFALQGMSKLIEIVELLQRRLNPELEITGILPCLYDSRLRLAREVLAEIRNYFPDKVFRKPVRTNVKLAEAPSYGQHIFEYAPESKGALDHQMLALAVLEQEARLDPVLAALPRPQSEETGPAPLTPSQPGKSPAREAETTSKSTVEPEVGTRSAASSGGEPSSTVSATGTPGEDLSGKPAASGPGTNGPLDEDRPAPAEPPAAERPAAEEPAKEQPAEERSAPDRSAADRAGPGEKAPAARQPGGTQGEEETQKKPVEGAEKPPSPPSARPRGWDSPEVGDVVLEPQPRRRTPAQPTRPSPAPGQDEPSSADALDDLPPLPPDAVGLGDPRPGNLRAHEG